jgi:hypothetical protein
MSKPIDEAVKAAYQALSDLRVEQKLEALERLRVLIELELASWTEEARTGKWQ